ncbi:2Fe-2S iron-sulfur cluster-binding protein [Paraburkholderia sp. DHOC27]|uniref:2Fe-2S iron-sulfur cluster-binding protein n=1 Tax=Paraburkholderia sp. DHOC27 TaxID=2303330 RepID=UPI000E3BFDA8|nr:2Fe-2S iron-sulfur cluster-binding protein [Paraburkholderia sp. DHOC27]RFU44063.1 (2Fe-2S)-binding protein [Paraburkholderia sp. DHOC27]
MLRHTNDSISVIVDGQVVVVDPGTLIVAALAMRGVRGTRQSVSGEPRAALCGMGICQECRVMVNGRSHVLACQTVCRDGQIIRTTGHL